MDKIQVVLMDDSSNTINQTGVQILYGSPSPVDALQLYNDMEIPE